MSERAKKVCMLTSRHRYDDARIYHKEIKTLSHAGYSLSLIAPDRTGDKVKLNEVDVQIFKKRKYFRKLFTLIDLVRIGLAQNAQCYHCHEGDSSLLAGVIIKSIFRFKKLDVVLVYDSHEHWPAFFSDRAPSGFKWLTLVLFSIYEMFLAKQCDAIITANDIVKKRFEQRNTKTPVIRLYNVPRLDLFKEKFNNIPEHYTFCHEGNITFDRGIKVLLNALYKLREFRTDWNFLFIGDVKSDGEKKYIEEFFKQNQGLSDYVSFTGWLDYEKLPEKLMQCEIGGIFFHPKQNNVLGGPPNKLFNYMRYGLPVIAPDYPEISKIISKYNCGFLIKEVTRESLINTFQTVLDNREEFLKRGINGYRAIKRTLNWKRESQRLVELYKILLA